MLATGQHVWFVIVEDQLDFGRSQHIIQKMSAKPQYYDSIIEPYRSRFDALISCYLKE